MVVLRRSRVWRLFLAALLVAGLTAGIDAYTGRMMDCTAGENVCGQDCAIWAYGCNWCNTPPGQCLIEFDECEEIHCDALCSNPCIIMP